ncbi:ribosome biogenesis protein NOP53 isoform X1 [Corvus moneduloides]|uniref:ribosome biogenesis protein NOP53 isoform X1 n=1 Tax=Corvus moneduloides TaxID=1196302 RepID=UPI0013641B29|nr:ribosome biogenesis protein NOP53 isoform X1 [Corvus moneduloides]
MAAAESFLAFNPAARPGPAAASRRRARGPRNRKKGWKRWSGPEAQLGREIGDFLEDVGLQERAAGGLISEQPDEGLFFLDTGNAPKGEVFFPKIHPPRVLGCPDPPNPPGQRLKKPPEKPLHVDLVLQPLSKVPPPKNICAHQTPNGRKEKRRQEFWEKKAEKGIFPRGERRLRARLSRGGAPTPQKPPELGRSDPQRSFYDIWGEHNPLDAPLAGQDPWYLQQTKKMRVQRPARLQAKPSPLPPVEVIGQGGSYNPPFQEHQDLLLRALEVETRRTREEEKVERRLKVTEEPPSEEAVLREQLQGLLEEEEEEEEEEQEENRDPPRKREQPGRKTEKQRRKEKEQREKAAGRARSRLASQRLQGLFRLRSLRRALLQRDSELRRRRLLRERRRLQRETAPRRLGRLRYEDPGPEVQLSEELPESLRSLRPEGNVLRDRFKSLQRRNMIEPRERAKFKRRYRVKYVEKRAFREVTV